VNPIVWTVVGAALGFVWGVELRGPLGFEVNLGTLLLGTFTGLFATTVVAAWPGLRRIPTEPCPRCGHRMPWTVVVCPECGEIR